MNYVEIEKNILDILLNNKNISLKVKFLYKKYIRKFEIKFYNVDDKVFFDLYFLNVIRTLSPKYENISYKKKNYFIDSIKYNNVKDCNEYDLDEDDSYLSDETISSDDSSFDDEPNDNQNLDYPLINYEYKKIKKNLIRFILDNDLREFYLLYDYEKNNLLHYLIIYRDYERFKNIIKELPLSFVLIKNIEKLSVLDYCEHDYKFKNAIYERIINKIDVIEENVNYSEEKFNLFNIIHQSENLKYTCFMFISVLYGIYIYNKINN